MAEAVVELLEELELKEARYLDTDIKVVVYLEDEVRI